MTGTFLVTTERISARSNGPEGHASHDRRPLVLALFCAPRMASSSGGGKRPTTEEEIDAQKPAQKRAVAEAVLTTSSAPAPAGMVLTSYDAAGHPRYVPLWAVKHPGMGTSKYGIIGTAVDTKAPPPTASSHDTTIKTPMYDKLCDVIHEHGGSLGDEGCEQYEELQVGAVNELILCVRTDKVDLLLQLLDVEGVELQATGVQPSPLLVLAKLEKAFHFLGMTRVWQKLIEQGADPDEKYGDESATA
eukprot:4339180-Prymnesium_polylepis.1